MTERVLSAHQYPVNTLDTRVFHFGVAACKHNILFTISLIISSADVRKPKYDNQGAPILAMMYMLIIVFIVGALGLSQHGFWSYIWTLLILIPEMLCTFGFAWLKCYPRHILYEVPNKISGNTCYDSDLDENTSKQPSTSHSPQCCIQMTPTFFMKVTLFSGRQCFISTDLFTETHCRSSEYYTASK